MDEQAKENLRIATIEWLNQSKDHTQSLLAEKTAISITYINQVVNKKWSEKYPSLSVWQELARFHGWEYHIDSQNYKSITALLSRAKDEKGRFAVNGSISGEGKTYAARKFCENTPQAYHIVCRESMKAKGLLRSVAKRLKIREYSRMDVAQLEDEIADFLKAKGGVLVFDECEYLETKKAALGSIKAICDLVEGRAGVVMIGLEIQQMLDYMLSLKRNRGVKQLKRRFNFKWLETTQITEKEIKNFCEFNSITNEHAIAWFINQVDNYDTLMILVKDALRVLKKAKKKLLKEGDKAAADVLVIDVDFLNEVFQS